MSIGFIEIPVIWLQLSIFFFNANFQGWDIINYKLQKHHSTIWPVIIFVASHSSYKEIYCKNAWNWLDLVSDNWTGSLYLIGYFCRVKQRAAPPIPCVWKEKETCPLTVYLPAAKTCSWSFFTGQTTGLTSEMFRDHIVVGERETPAEPSDDLCTQFVKSDLDLECDQIWILVLYFNDCNWLCFSATIKVTSCGALTLSHDFACPCAS